MVVLCGTYLRRWCHALLVLWLLAVNDVSCQKYVVFQKPVNWYQALINCKKAGMELASIHSKQEHNALENYLINNGYDRGYWLAATKEGNGEFYWATTGAKMVYTKWLNGQPDNAIFDANYNEGEHCVAWGMSTYTPDPYGWNDATCNNVLSYVCQEYEYCEEPNNIQ